MQETPFSIYITVRKSFSKPRYPKELDEDISEDKASVNLSKLIEQSEMDGATIIKYAAQSVVDRETIAILESKVVNAEGELYDYFANHKKSIHKKQEEINVLKGTLKNKDYEIIRNKNEISKYSKLAKAHEKEIYRVEKLN